MRMFVNGKHFAIVCGACAVKIFLALYYGGIGKVTSHVARHSAGIAVTNCERPPVGFGCRLPPFLLGLRPLLQLGVRTADSAHAVMPGIDVSVFALVLFLVSELLFPDKRLLLGQIVTGQ